MQNPDEHLIFAENALRSGAYEQAFQAYEEYLQIHPADERALIGAGEVNRHLNDTAHICELYQRACAAAPDNLTLKGDLIEAMMADQQTNEALDLAKKFHDQYPDVVQFNTQIAQSDMVLGNTDAARSRLWECVDADPDGLDPVYYLSQLAHKDDMARLGTTLDGLWHRRDMFDEGQLIILGYAVGKIAEKQKRYDDAWEGYETGAKIRRSRTRFNEPAYIHNLDLHKNLFGKAPVNSGASPDAGLEFVFIVSLPRSGSTLVEQILASHRDVEGIGERGFSIDAFKIWYDTSGVSRGASLHPADFTKVRDYYINAAKEATTGPSRIIVDKTISNFLYLGFLHTILPGARFVHVVRDPLDTAFSCFATAFYSGVDWSYDQGETGRAVRRYQKIMRHWMTCWPDRIKTFRYESFVNDLEPATRELLDFCGLEWDPACLDFHKNKREVLTSSVAQVRQPIYQSAKGRASHFESHLGPLKSAMGRAADPDWFLTP